MNLQNLEEKLMTGGVRRCHTTPSFEYQSIGQHSWGVAMIILNLHPDPSLQLIKAALQHDMAEMWLGDVPATAKWRFSNLATSYREAEETIEAENNLSVELIENELIWLKAADILELALWSRLQIKMGNTLYEPILGRCVDWMNTHKVPGPILELLEEM